MVVCSDTYKVPWRPFIRDNELEGGIVQMTKSGCK